MIGCVCLLVLHIFMLARQTTNRTELCYSDITIDSGSGVDIWHVSNTFWFASCINKLLLVMPQLCDPF